MTITAETFAGIATLLPLLIFAQPGPARIGTLIFSIAVGMTADEVNPEALSYGYDRVRFIKPVFIGDTLHVRITVKKKEDAPKSPRHGIVAELCEALNQRQEVVFACEHLLMVTRRPHL